MVLGTNILTQVALVVNDIDKAKERFAAFFGVDVPPTIEPGEFEITQVHVKGQPAPNAKCRLAFFSVGENVSIELIEPNETSSVWRDFLDEKGEGLHHIAFGIKDTDAVIKSCEDFGMELVQKGNYGSGGGCYSYLSGDKAGLPMIIELLESF